ncbi:hypothetical protein [Tenacibaculum sp. Bg11-29]|uniref:hypothetical protein n=1 Tax=Tenacibaculum sp. Bg11-29 TaxID=2058306 RepID=UPI0012FF0AA6|nr:hypothetical protein [Tenacibaculum sp. Bg11-29]
MVLYLQELLGHKTKSTTDIYLDVFPQEKIDNYHRMVIDTVLNVGAINEYKKKPTC